MVQTSVNFLVTGTGKAVFFLVPVPCNLYTVLIFSFLTYFRVKKVNLDFR